MSENTQDDYRNYLLAELRCAVLRAKLPHLDGWNRARAGVADRYRAGLKQTPLQLPAVSGEGEMIYHLYIIRTAERDHLLTTLREKGIGCDVHYPIPDHLQPACADLGYGPGALPVTERAAVEVLTLPCFAELTSTEVEQVIFSVKESLDG